MWMEPQTNKELLQNTPGIFDTSKFHKLLDDEWLDGRYICLNSILYSRKKEHTS
jgi:hypothetical protein